MKTLQEQVKEAFSATGADAMQALLLAMAAYIGTLTARIEALEKISDEDGKLIQQALSIADGLQKLHPVEVAALVKSMGDAGTETAAPGPTAEPLPALDPAVIAAMQPAPVAAPQQ